MSKETFIKDNLFAGDYPVETDVVTVLSGSDLVRGTILGKITVGAVPTTGTADVGNTGDGTLTVVTGGNETKVGVYTIKCVEAVTNGGIFQVIDPDGIVLGQFIIAAGAGGTIAFTTAQINGTITDGSTDFVLDDEFTVTVPAGSGKVVAVDSSNIDGSQNPYSILAEDTDASAADVAAPAYLTGSYTEEVLVVGGSDSVAQHKAACRDLSIFIKNRVNKYQVYN